MAMICPIPKEETYDLPEGRFRAHLVSARMQTKFTNGKAQQLVRLLFEVDIPSLSMKRKIPMAGRSFTFELKRRSELRGFIENWKGTNLLASTTTFDIEQLVGQSGDIVLIHHHNPNHPRPIVQVDSMHVAGSLRLTEKPVSTAELVAAINEADQQEAA